MEILNCEPAIKDGAYDGETIVKGKVEFRNVSLHILAMKVPVL